MSKDLVNLQKLHKKLRKAKYHYYEKSVSIMTDYAFDELEKEYVLLANKLDISEEKRVTNYVGFSIKIPMSPIT